MIQKATRWLDQPVDPKASGNITGVVLCSEKHCATMTFHFHSHGSSLHYFA